MNYSKRLPKYILIYKMHRSIYPNLNIVSKHVNIVRLNQTVTSQLH